jgi:signal transduction histidine kinase
MEGISSKPGIMKFKAGIFHALFYLLIGAVVFRMAPYYLSPTVNWPAIGLMLLYVLVFITERLITKKPRVYFPIFFTIQLGVIFLLILIHSETAPKDYFVNLAIPLSGTAIWNLTEKTAKRWIAVFCSFCLVTMIAYYRSFEGLSFGLVYTTGCLFVMILIQATKRADAERQKSQALLDELKIANKKLEEYSEQVQSLAAAEERNRLARELHDSVSQTVFSINLTAESAKILIDRDPERVKGLLNHLQTLSQNALGEMRSLIRHLRPGSMEGEGLGEALRKHARERLKINGLSVELSIQGERRLNAQVEDGIFRIVQEALNNIEKHAKTNSALVELDLSGDTASIVIEDHGIGFSPEEIGRDEGKFGIASMKERAAAIGGSLQISSNPGEGTRIRIEGIPIKESIEIG